MENDVVFAVHQIYYGLLVAGKTKEAAEAGLKAAEESLREAEIAVRARTALEVILNETRTAVLRNKQTLLAAKIQIADLTSEQNNFLGLPLDTQLELSDPGPSDRPIGSRDEYLHAALSENPEIASAKASVTKAESGVKAAKYEYIPDVTLFASNTYQDGASVLKHDVASAGVMMKWDLWDWGKRKAVSGERRAQLSQATENERRVNDAVTVELDKAYRKLEDTKSIMDVAREALALQQERLRLISDQIKTSTATYTQYNEAVAAVRMAEATELQARLSYQLAIADLDRIAGTFKR
jgi:outer membrane protein TolC